MPDEEKNAALMRELWRRWDETKGKDLSMWDDYVTDDLRIRSLADGGGGLRFTAPKKGRDQLREYLEGLMGAFSMDYWRLDEVIAKDDVVVGLGSSGFTNRDTGRSFETAMAIITRWRDGKICEYTEFYDTARISATMA